MLQDSLNNAACEPICSFEQKNGLYVSEFALKPLQLPATATGAQASNAQPAVFARQGRWAVAHVEVIMTLREGVTKQNSTPADYVVNEETYNLYKLAFWRAWWMVVLMIMIFSWRYAYAYAICDIGCCGVARDLAQLPGSLHYIPQSMIVSL